MTTAEQIAKRLGRDCAYQSGLWWRAPCPVHGSSGPTLALGDGWDRLLVCCHAGCPADEILAELRRRDLLGDGPNAGISTPDPAEAERHSQTEARRRERRIAEAQDIFADAIPAAGTVVERYLRARGITMPIPSVIRMGGMLGVYGQHPSGSRRPQMVALVEHSEHGPTAVSRTFLATDGSGKACGIEPARIFSGPVKGGAVRLAEASETLMVGEGIETVMAAIEAKGLPGWAAMSTNGLKALVLPPIVRHVVILADNDDNGAGERAAHTAAQRWLAEGRRVRIAMSPEPGTDFNDLLMGRCHAGVLDVAA